MRNLRRHIALVTQQTTLFNDTVANNIAYGDLAGTPRADIEKAAEAAYAKEFIEKLPDTYGRRKWRVFRAASDSALPSFAPS